MGKILLASHQHPKYPRLQLQQRSNSKFLQAVMFLDGKMRMRSMKTTDLKTGFKLGEDWYRRELKASVTFGNQHPIARLTTDPTMADLFKNYHAALDARKRPYAMQKWSPIQDFWRTLLLSEITTETFKDFYRWRRRQKTVGNHTLHKDVCVIRQLLGYALNDSLLTATPHIPPTGTISKNPRPWFTPTEWTALRTVAKSRITKAPNRRTRAQRAEVLDTIDFLHASMMRVGELQTLRFRSCRAEKNTDGDKMLLCEVSGKRGTRTCVAHAAAAVIYAARLKRAQPDDLIFPTHCRDGFRELLVAAKLRVNEQGFERNLKSVRATAISHKLLEDPDVNLVWVARNAGTSVAMIDEFYAKRLSPEMHKDRLSALPASSVTSPKQWRQLAHLLERANAHTASR